MATATTWHYGLVARWWAEFNNGGDDIEYFRRCIARSGQPVLDAGCGTGRVLLPLLESGIDIDGSDASPDMLDWCRRRAPGHEVALYAQRMHELELPRRYRTILVCGAFGVGSTREQDLEGLRRLRAHLAPGGALYLDHHLPNVHDRASWPFWAQAPDLPQPWPDRTDRRTASDGSELELAVRMLDLDPLQQTARLEMRASQFADGELLQTEHNTVDLGLYFKNEIELMLHMAGFADVRVTTLPDDLPPRPWQDARIVFTATG